MLSTHLRQGGAAIIVTRHCYLGPDYRGKAMLTDVLRVLITDKLDGDTTAKKEVMPSVKHHQYKRLSNCAENSLPRGTR